MQSVNDASKRSGQIVQSSYQSAWMAHWMQPSCNSEAAVTPSENDNLTSGLLVPKPLNVLGAKTSDVVDKNLIMSSTNSGKQGLTNFGFVKGKEVIVSNNQLSSASTRILDEEYRQSADTCLRQSNTSLLLDAPSTSRHQLQFEKILKCCNKSSYGFHSPHKLSTRVQNLDTMRICTTVEETGVGSPSFSQKTQSLLIASQTDTKQLQVNDIFGSTSRVLTKTNGNKPTDRHNSILPFLGQGNGGVKLQSLSSSSHSEGKRKYGYGSLAETDTTDTSAFKTKLNYGASSIPSTKAAHIESNLSPAKTELSDINMEAPALPAVAISLDNTCPSSSRTQSLEMDMLLAHAEKPKRKSSFDLYDSPNADPSERWLKRLKRTSSNSSRQGTKSSDFSEKTSHEKMSKYFKGIFRSSIITSSEPTSSNHLGKEPILWRKSLDEDLQVDPPKEDNDLLFSHAWIQRFLSKGFKITEKKKAEAIVVCEPQSSKLALEDLTKKQFPSIAAMAMMGKTMNGFQACEIQKKGPFTVWNTKAF